MQIEIEKLPKSELKVTIKLTNESWAEYLNKSLATLSKKIKVDGFREGHAPLEIVKKTIGEDKLIGHTIETFIGTIYAEAIKKEGITPLSRPIVDILKDSPLEFTAIVAVKPEFEIKNLEKIKIKAPKVEVSAKEVDEAIDHIRKSKSELKEVEGKTKKGHQVEIDFDGSDEKGVAIEGASSKNHPIVIGDGNFIPGFEDNILDLAVNEEKEFTVTFPADYHAKHLQSKPVTFKIKVNKIQERVLPEITEEFSEAAIGKKLDEKQFREFIKHELVHELTHKKQAEQEDELFDTLLKSTKFEVSDQLVEEETQILIEEMSNGIKRQGMNPEDYFKFLESKDKKTKEEIFKDKAIDRVKIKFIIEYTIKKLNIEASADEINAKIAAQTEKAPKEMKANVEKYYAEGQPGREAIRQQVILDKLFSTFLEPIPHCNDHSHHHHG